METLKISPSLLDQYRSVCAGEFNKTAEDLIEYIVGDYQPNIHTSRGNAYHEMIEYGPDGYMDLQPFPKPAPDAIGPPAPEVSYKVYEKALNKTWTFSAESVRPIFDLRRNYPDMLHEVWYTHWMRSHGYNIRIRLKYDGLDGLECHEFKSTGSSKKSDDYRKTLQWKLYLLANPELISVKYHVFQLGRLTVKNQDKAIQKCTAKEFVFRPYPEMESDVQAQLDGLVGWLKTRPSLLKKLEALEDRSPWAVKK